MKREDVIQLARECGFSVGIGSPALPKFTALIEKAVAGEREDCAKVCDRIDLEYEGEDVQATWCAEAIRARKDNT